MISNTSMFHGAALLSIIDEIGTEIAIRRLNEEYIGFYLLNNKIPVYLKYASKNKSPWSFTFNSEHIKQYFELCDNYGDCIMILVCGIDGLVSLLCQEMRQLIYMDNISQKSIQVARRLKQMYKVTGSDGTIGKKIGKNGVIEIIKALLYNKD